jgi:hypothetical protein
MNKHHRCRKGSDDRASSRSHLFCRLSQTVVVSGAEQVEVVEAVVEAVEVVEAEEEMVEEPLDHTSWLDLVNFCKILLRGPWYQFLVPIEHLSYLNIQLVDIGSSFDARRDTRKDHRHRRAQDGPSSNRKDRLRDMEALVVMEEHSR